MNYEEKKKAAERLHEKARDMRGRFLNHAAVIERQLAVIITGYFCGDNEEKRELFFERVAERLSLQMKKEILIDIVSNDYPEFWEENKELVNQLSEVQAFRNKLAHSTVDVSDEALDRPLKEGISFLQWKGGQLVTDQEFDDLVVKANAILSVLEDVQNLLPFKEFSA